MHNHRPRVMAVARGRIEAFFILASRDTFLTLENAPLPASLQEAYSFRYVNESQRAAAEWHTLY